MLKDENDDESVIPLLLPADFAGYVESGVIQGGMIPKLENAYAALKEGVSKVVITRADQIHKAGGTTVVLSD